MTAPELQLQPTPLPFHARVTTSRAVIDIALMAEGLQQAEIRAIEIAASEHGPSAVVGGKHVENLALCAWADFYHINTNIKPGWRLPDPPSGFTTPCALLFDNAQIALDWTRHRGDFAADHDDLNGVAEIEWPFVSTKSPPRYMPTAADWLRVGISIK